MPTAERLMRKWVLVFFWIALATHCLFQYMKWPYVAVTKPMLVPLLLTFLLVRDTNIGRPLGKFVFYVGMFLALFGDVLLIAINDTFFLSGMIAFMLMNLCFTWAFIKLEPLHWRKTVPLLITTAILFFIGDWFYHFLADEMGDYAIPVLIYMITVSLMTLAAVNIASGRTYRATALQYFIPGALVFMVENAFVALNRFHFDNDKNIYIGIMFGYGLAQFLFTKGVEKSYLNHP
jgi:uncharacterized membrane protein YhhN